MSQHNVCEALSQFERESRRSVEAQLANIEASFDLGYLQSDDGRSVSVVLLFVHVGDFSFSLSPF